MKHKEKVKLARKMRGNLPKKKFRVPLFMTDAWENRKEAIAERHNRKQAEAHARAEARKEERKQNENR